MTGNMARRGCRGQACRASGRHHRAVVRPCGECSNACVSNSVRKARRHTGPLPRLLLAALVALVVRSGAARSAEVDLSPYVYEDTKQLVTLVNDAAALMAQKGDAAFADFQVPHSRWRHGEYYLFVYAVDGTCVFHPEEPAFVGKNLIDLRDIDGRQVTRAITDIARRPEPDAGGWVFYMWEDRRQLSPAWKAAYIRKVVTPDGKVYAHRQRHLQSEDRAHLRQGQCRSGGPIAVATGQGRARAAARARIHAAQQLHLRDGCTWPHAVRPGVPHDGAARSVGLHGLGGHTRDPEGPAAAGQPGRGVDDLPAAAARQPGRRRAS